MRKHDLCLNTAHLPKTGAALSASYCLVTAEYGSVNFYMPSNMHRCICTQYTLHTINFCLSIFQIVNLSHRYVLCYDVNILKYLSDTYYMECLIMTKVTIDRSILILVLEPNCLLRCL